MSNSEKRLSGAWQRSESIRRGPPRSSTIREESTPSAGGVVSLALFFFLPVSVEELEGREKVT